MRAALGRTALLLIVGSAAGLLLGIAASRLPAMVVYQASALDPVVLIGVLATMAVVGVASAALPAKQAFAVNPAKLLRESDGIHTTSPFTSRIFLLGDSRQDCA
jgi:ABC-type antimicrobial peptide transport system permease subunit